MNGRYGNDGLGYALLILSFSINLIGSFFGPLRNIFAVVAYLPLGYEMFRFLSRNIYKRQNENRAFMRLYKPLKKETKRWYLNLSQRQYKHYNCPSCSQMIRVPAHRGRIEISCPSCRKTFIKKT
jgi:hypothetical protein